MSRLTTLVKRCTFESVPHIVPQFHPTCSHCLAHRPIFPLGAEHLPHLFQTLPKSIATAPPTLQRRGPVPRCRCRSHALPAQAPATLYTACAATERYVQVAPTSPTAVPPPRASTSAVSSVAPSDNGLGLAVSVSGVPQSSSAEFGGTVSDTARLARLGSFPLTPQTPKRSSSAESEGAVSVHGWE